MEDNNFIRYELERINKNQEKIFEKIDAIHINIATLDTSLKIKSSIWGLLGGAIPVCITLCIYIIKCLI